MWVRLPLWAQNIYAGYMCPAIIILQFQMGGERRRPRSRPKGVAESGQEPLPQCVQLTVHIGVSELTPTPTLGTKSGILKTSMHTLQELIDHIGKTWVCDAARYPELAGMSEVDRLNFIIKHQVLHLSKTTGKLATLAEAYDHSREGLGEASEELRNLATKLFINSLKLAEEVGMSADDLLTRSKEFVK
jgi:hypothetical protein